MMEKINLETEFYRILKEEYRQYLNYSENLWKLKFVSIGAIISFLIFNERIFEFLDENDLVAIGILIIPIFAFIIDLKILETGFHLKSISNYLENNLQTFKIAQQWEKENWSGGFFRRNRGFLLSFGTGGISYIILFLCLYIVSRHLMPSWTEFLIIAGFLLLIVGLIFYLIIYKKMFKRNNLTASKTGS